MKKIILKPDYYIFRMDDNFCSRATLTGTGYQPIAEKHI